MSNRDWTMTLEFGGRGVVADLEAMMDALHEHAPENVSGIEARADAEAREVWFTFTVEGVSAAHANRLASDLATRINAARGVGA